MDNAASEPLCQQFEVFLCYNSQDSVVVSAIGKRLQRLGVKIWHDGSQVLAGGLPLQEIMRALKRCNACVIFLGSHGPGKYQAVEVMYALTRHVETSQAFRIIPVILPGGSSSHAEDLGLSIFSRIEFNVWGGSDAAHAHNLYKLYCTSKGLGTNTAVMDNLTAVVELHNIENGGSQSHFPARVAARPGREPDEVQIEVDPDGWYLPTQPSYSLGGMQEYSSREKRLRVLVGILVALLLIASWLVYSNIDKQPPSPKPVPTDPGLQLTTEPTVRKPEPLPEIEQREGYHYVLVGPYKDDAATRNAQSALMPTFENAMPGRFRGKRYVLVLETEDCDSAKDYLESLKMQGKHCSLQPSCPEKTTPPKVETHETYVPRIVKYFVYAGSYGAEGAAEKDHIKLKNMGIDNDVINSPSLGLVIYVYVYDDQARAEQLKSVLIDRGFTDAFITRQESSSTEGDSKGVP